MGGSEEGGDKVCREELFQYYDEDDDDDDIPGKHFFAKRKYVPNQDFLSGYSVSILE